MKYAIIDVETTGMGVQGNRITEIAILVHDGEKVLERFQTLVNPQSSIPYSISRLTGIYDHMVQNAPKFYEIAKKVVEITEDCVFVAHNVNFDYNVIRKEFQDLGFSFSRKKLCTIRLARKLIPGLPSYSLGKICAQVGIEIQDRHRAMGDAEATVILFEKLMHLDSDDSVFDSFLKPRSREATLPPKLPKQVFDNLPESTGVYYFRNEEDDIIYVGKALNIKKRVLSHFYDRKNREVTMCQQTSNITYEITGSELVALLLESSEIKKHYPTFNRAQRRSNEGYGVFSYTDRSGIMHLAWNKLRQISNPLAKFYNTTECRLYVERICEEFELCPKYCHLQTNVSACFHYQIKICKGICRDKEQPESYNERVKLAIEEIRGESDSCIIQEPGRHEKEQSFVLIENGVYLGFGYTEVSVDVTNLNFYRKKLILQQDNRDVQRILRGFMNKNKDKITYVLSDQNHQAETGAGTLFSG
ncbi:MAG: exonuclease domain-containing protein [Lutimonas sp.]